MVIPPEPEPEPEMVIPPEPEPETDPEPPPEVPAEPHQPAPWPPEAAGDEAPTAEVPALSEEQLAEPPENATGQDAPLSVTDIVDDLLSPAEPGRDREGIQDATVIDSSAERPAPGEREQEVPWQEEPARDEPTHEDPAPESAAPPANDADLALAVRSKLAEQPGLLPGTVDLEVMAGVVILRGEARHLETIAELGRRAGAVAGVQEVRNLLHLPGEESPPGDKRP